MNKKWFWATFALALAFLAPSVVMAQTLPDLTPGQSDVTVKYFLNELFGGLVGSGGANPMAEVIGKVNGVILILGGLLLGYGLVAGVMQTAHDGEVLGKKWSSMWMPIRMSIGIAAIAPLPSGYSVIQHVVMWLVLQGVGAANLVWTTFAAQTSQLSNISLINDNPKGREIAETVLRQQLCVVVATKEIEKITSAGNSMIASKMTKPVIASVAGGDGSYCGSYNLITRPLVVSPNFAGGVGVSVDTRPISAAHLRAFNYLSSNLNTLANKIYTNVESGGAANNDISIEFGNVLDSYNNMLTQAATATINAANNGTQNTIVDRAAQDGWGMAGAFYMKYMYMKQAAQIAMQEFPTLVPPKLEAIPSDDLRQSVDAYQKRLSVILADIAYKNSFGVVEQVKADKADSSAVNLAASSFRVSAAEWVYKGAVGNKPIMIATKDFGDTVWTGAISANMAIVGGSYLISAAKCNMVVGKTGVCDAWKTSLAQLQPFIFTITGALLGFSALLAFYLPVAPFILWFGIVIGWCVLVVEAILAAPLWAIAHVHPDGDGVVGRGGQGYSLVLALFLRPVFAVMGLIASMMLMDPIGKMFASTYWAAFAIGQEGSSIQLLGTFVAAFGIFSVVIVGIINRVFSLSHVIPDQILKWIGGPSGELGSYAGDLAKIGAGNATAVGGVLGNVAAKGMESKKIGEGVAAEKEQATMARERAASEAKASSDRSIAARSGMEQEIMGAGTPEGAGIVAAKLAGNEKRGEAQRSAISALMSGKGSGGVTAKQYATAQAQGHDGAMVWDEVKAQNGGKNLDEIQAGAESSAYGEWAGKTEKKHSGNEGGGEAVAPTYDKALSNLAAAKSAQTSGTGGDTSAPSGQSEGR